MFKLLKAVELDYHQCPSFAQKMEVCMMPKWLNKLGSNSSQTPDIFKHLKKSFGLLDTVSPGISDELITYICTGSNPEILIRVQKDLDLNGELLMNPGRIMRGVWASNFSSSSLFKDATEKVKYRDEFYQSLNQDNTAPSSLVRLGHVLAAVDKGNSLEDIGIQAPTWILYLLNDLMFCATQDGSYPKKAPVRPGWRLAMVEDVLQEGGLQPELLVFFLFEAKDVSTWYTNPLHFMMTWPDSESWLVSHESEIRQTWRKLSAVGRRYFISGITKSPILAEIYADLTVRLAVDASKTVRDDASKHLASIPVAKRHSELRKILQDGSSAEKINVVNLLARLPSEEGNLLLEAALSSNPGKALEESLKTALSQVRASKEQSFEYSPLPPVEVPQETPLSESVYQLILENREMLRKDLMERAAKEVESNKSDDIKYKSTYAQKHWDIFKNIPEKRVRELFKLLQNPDPNLSRLPQSETSILTYQNRLLTHDEITLGYLFNLISLTGDVRRFWADDRFQKWLAAHNSDSLELRFFAKYLEPKGLSLRGVAGAALKAWWHLPSAVEYLEPKGIWPFFMEHPQFLDEALGMCPATTQNSYDTFELNQALKVVKTFPEIPPAYVARVIEIALGEGKTHRAQAQELAATLPNIISIVVSQLTSAKKERRLIAAAWLAQMGAREAIPAMQAALKKEKAETVRGALLHSLEILGHDIQQYLASSTLLAEAKKGLGGKLPAGLSWFPLDRLPAVRWAADNSIVAPEIIKWWVVFVFKLKEPGGNALIDRYLGLINSHDCSELSTFILRQFIKEDSRTPTLEEANAYAQANAQAQFDMYQRWAKQYPNSDFYSKTYEQCFEDLKRAKLSTYLGSVISSKGILALVSRAPGHEIVSLLQHYMRDHYTRTAQITAMLEAVASSKDPVVIQLLLTIARRYRTAGIQERARQLVAKIAEMNGWTQDQLADRTIPTAGFDDQGECSIDYGDRKFTVIIDPSFKPVLLNSEGKSVKSLPPPRKSDDPAVVKDAKSAWSQCRKEFKQIVELQSLRLYEAMCACRSWPYEEWQEYILQHPIVGRLSQQLVWVQTDAVGQLKSSFRPTEDGCLIDLEDEEVLLTDGSFISIAHSSILGPDISQLWIKHFTDYKVKALFPQMNRTLPALTDSQTQSTELTDRKGWLSDTFTLRGILTKLGYKRATAEDGGFFDHYYKEFSSAKVRVCVGFSGNCLPEENVAAALTTLSFEKMDVKGWRSELYRLSEVPSVLLGEAYSDYLLVAESATFDSEWEKKMPW